MVMRMKNVSLVSDRLSSARTGECHPATRRAGVAGVPSYCLGCQSGTPARHKAKATTSASC